MPKLLFISLLPDKRLIMAALFDFTSFNIAKLSYHRTDEQVSNGEISFKPSIQRALEDRSKIKYALDISLNGPTQISLVIEGYFLQNNDDPEEEMDIAILSIGLTTLVPYARSIISTITSFDGSNPVTIPLVNVQELLSNVVLFDDDQPDLVD